MNEGKGLLLHFVSVLSHLLNLQVDPSPQPYVRAHVSQPGDAVSETVSEARPKKEWNWCDSAPHLSIPTCSTSMEFQPMQILNQPGFSAL